MGDQKGEEKEEGNNSTMPKPGSSGRTPDRREVEAKRKRDDKILKRAAELKTVWRSFLPAFQEPWKDPPRETTHWDYLLKEAKWLANDVMQERIWKIAAARHVAFAALDYWNAHYANKRFETSTKSKKVACEGKEGAQSSEPEKATAVNDRQKQENGDLLNTEESGQAASTTQVLEGSPSSGGKEIESSFTFSWKNGSKEVLLSLMQQKAEDMAIEYDKFLLKYQHDYESARIATSTLDLDLDSDEELIPFRVPPDTRDDQRLKRPPRKPAKRPYEAETPPVGQPVSKKLKHNYVAENAHAQPASQMQRQPTENVPFVGKRPSRGWARRPGNNAAAQANGMASLLSSHQDQLLFAGNGEFNGNWHIISDFLASSGIYLRPDTCQERVQAIESDIKQAQAQQLQPGQHQNHEDNFFRQIRLRTKEILGNVISEDLVKKRQANLVQQHNLLMAKKEEAKLQRDQPSRGEMHVSHQQRSSSVMQCMGGRFLSPKESWMQAKGRQMPQVMTRNCLHSGQGSMGTEASGMKVPPTAQGVAMAQGQASTPTGMDPPLNNAMPMNQGMGMGPLGSATPPANMGSNVQGGGLPNRTPTSLQLGNMPSNPPLAAMAALRQPGNQGQLLQHCIRNGSYQQRKMLLMRFEEHKRRQAAQAAQQAAQANVHGVAAMNPNSQMGPGGMPPRTGMPSGNFGMPSRPRTGLRPSTGSPVIPGNVGLGPGGNLGQGGMPGVNPLNPRGALQPSPTQSIVSPSGGASPIGGGPLNPAAQLQGQMPSAGPGMGGMQVPSPLLGLPGRVVTSGSLSGGLQMGAGLQGAVGGLPMPLSGPGMPGSMPGMAGQMSMMGGGMQVSGVTGLGNQANLPMAMQSGVAGQGGLQGMGGGQQPGGPQLGPGPTS